MGNRCGHDPSALGKYNKVKRGPGGHPQTIQVMVSKLQQAANTNKRGLLKDLNHLRNPFRRMRTERWEACTVVLQYLATDYLQMIGHRCAIPDDQLQALVAPTHTEIANGISRSPAWAGKPPMTAKRVQRALRDLGLAGYIKRPKQTREQRDDGSWQFFPRLVIFLKKLFVHLGGPAWWGRVHTDSTLLAADRGLTGTAVVKQLMFPGKVFSLTQAAALRRLNFSKPR